MPRAASPKSRTTRTTTTTMTKAASQAAVPLVNFMDFLAGLEPRVRDLVFCDASTAALHEVLTAVAIDDERILDVTALLNEMLMKRMSMSDLPTQLQEKLGLTAEVAKSLAVELIAKQLLVVDDYFDGAASRALQQLGVNPHVYDEFLVEYRQKVAAEKEAERLAAAPLPDITPVAEEEESEETVFVLGTPEQELTDMKNILHNNPTEALMTDNLELRIAINVAITQLLLEKPEVFGDLLLSLTTCPQEVTTQPIIVKNESVTPTVEHWLQDFVASVRADDMDRLSTIQKAKYYNESPNFKPLLPGERDVVQRLFTLYENLINFQTDIQRLPLEEIQIFPFTEDEQLTYLHALEKMEINRTVTPEDINAVYQGDTEEQDAIVSTVASITEKMTGDTVAMINYLYDNLLGRKRVETIAALQVLAKVGALDDVVAGDRRFQELLQAYFKRNNLIDQIEIYRSHPSDPKFVKFFLKYVLMERLGMREHDAARVGVQLANIFREQGMTPLAQLAVFDMEQKKFYWL